eukprot:TRINITY_DN3773_c0_g1_i1.p1 TRINITY_DN3773_c0_g1~~TRINITY_DN3773_c0_g1_i1.p1  ORF type:complete len:153 (-),score=5.20 TRINITY_DN3773_c0_g1_i1:580-1038(-)
MYISLIPRISRSSFAVHAACTGPRLPTKKTLLHQSNVKNSTSNNHFSNERRNFETTNLIVLSSRASNAWLAISVVASSDVDRRRIRATSRATLPCPRTTTVSVLFKSGASLLQSGCPLYHQTNSLAEYIPAKSSPGTPRTLSLSAPYASTTT